MDKIDKNKDEQKDKPPFIHSSFNIEIDKEKHIAYFIYRRVPHGIRINNNILDKLSVYEFLYEISVVHRKNFSELILKVNLEQVLSLISSGNPVPGIKILVEILRFIRIDIKEHTHYQKNIINYGLKPVVYDIDDSDKNDDNDQSNGSGDGFEFLKSDSKPYQFQKLNIDWMLQRETDILTDTEHNECLYYHDDNWFVYHPLSISINIDNANVYLGEPLTKTVGIKGGCLIDDINLGKTLSGIGLILKDTHKCGKDRIEKKNMDGILTSRYILTNATLVVTSKKSINKWKLELEKKVEPNHLPKFLVLATKNSFENAEYHDFINSKIVFVSYDMIFSKNYRNIFSKFAKLTYFDVENLPDFNHLVDTYCSYQINRLDLEQSSIDSGLVLQLFKWHRIIFDDIHEMINSKLHSTHMKMLLSLDSNFKWCFSGVPFMNNFSNYIDYLKLTTDISEPDSIMKCYELNMTLASRLFRRNTVQSISKEYTFPEIYEKVVHLQMDHLPRLIYDNLNHFTSIENIAENEKIKLKLKFCSNIFLLEEVGNLARNTYNHKEIKKTLIERTKKSIEDKKMEYQIFSNKMENKKTKLRYLELQRKNNTTKSNHSNKKVLFNKQLSNNMNTDGDSNKSGSNYSGSSHNGSSSDDSNSDSENEEFTEEEEEMSSSMLVIRNELENAIRKYQKKLDHLENEIVKLNNQTYIGRIKSSDVCSICENERESVLLCGHSVCLTCVINYYHFGEKFKCPVCRRPLSFEDIFVIGNPQVYYKKIKNLFKILKSIYKGKREREEEREEEHEHGQEYGQEHETEYSCDLLLVSEYRENFEIVKDELELDDDKRLTINLIHDKSKSQRKSEHNAKSTTECIVGSNTNSDSDTDSISDIENPITEKEMSVRFNFTTHNAFQKSLNEKKYDAVVFLDLPVDLSLLSSNNNFIKKYYHIGDETDGIQIYYLIYKNTVEEIIWKENA